LLNFNNNQQSFYTDNKRSFVRHGFYRTLILPVITLKQYRDRILTSIKLCTRPPSPPPSLKLRGSKKATEAERWQKVRHTFITHRSFSEGGPCTVTAYPSFAKRKRFGGQSRLKYQDPAGMRRVTLTNYTANRYR